MNLRLRFDVASDGYLVDFGQEVGFVDVGVNVGIVEVVVGEVLLFYFSLFVVEQTLYFLHVDDPIDLLGSQFAEPILLAGYYTLLVHVKFAPILWQ